MKIKIKIKRALKNILLWGLGFGIIFLIINYIGISDVIHVFLSMDIGIFLFAIILYCMMVFTIIIRWKYLLNMNNYDASLKNLFLLSMMGQFINNITPSMKGGSEPFRAHYLSKLENIPKHISYSSVAIERLLDTIVFLILSLFLIVYFVISGIQYANLLILMWSTVMIISLLIIYLAMHKSLLYKCILKILKIMSIFSPSYRIDENEIKKSIKLFQDNIRLFNKNKSKMLIPFILSYIWWILDMIRVYVLFIAIKSNILFIGVFSTYLVSLLVGMVPTLPGGLGASDAVMIGMYSLFNIPQSEAAAGTILDRTISYGLATAVGAISFKIIKDKAKNLKIKTKIS
jgi:uncharacterized protein (TIRG00374 family)